MITSYEVGAVYRIVDQATPTLIKIAGLLEKIAGLSKQAEGHLRGLGTVRIGAISKELGSLETKLGGVAKEAGVAREGLVTAFSRADASIAATTGAVGKLTAELAAARKEAAGLRLPGPGGGGGRHPRPGQGGGSGGGSSGGHGSPSMAGHTGIQLGVMGFFGAEAVGHGLKEVLKEASELEHVQQQMIQAGFKEVDIAKARNAAWAEAGKYGLNVAKVLGDIKELTLPFGSLEHAIEFINPLEKMKIVLNSVSEGKGSSAADAVYKMARAGELKGLQDPHEFVSYFDNMTKAISASGGKVTPNDFMQATKYSKLSGMGFNEEYFTKYLPTLIQTMGASTAGTASQSLFSTLVQGTVTKRALGRMDDLGLIGDPSKLVFDNKGDPKGFNPGAIIGTETLVKNPFEWAQKFLLPLLEKKYGSIDVAENKQKAIEDLGGLFGNRNSAAAIAELALRGKTFNKDAALIEQARGIGGADAMLKDDPKAVAEKLHGAWTNLMTALGGPGVKIAVDGMNSLASGITSLTKWANENPAATKIILEAMVGLGAALAALTVAGAVAGAMLLAPGGAVVVGITALVGVLGSLAAFNWDALKDIGTKIKDALMGPVDAIAAVWDRVKSLFGSLLNKTSFDGVGGFDGSMIHNASFSTGGGANDNFGGSSGVARAMGRGGFGGAGGGFDRGGVNAVGGSTQSRAHYLMGRLIAKGWTPEAAAAAAGNAVQESGVRPHGVTGDSGTAHGIFQWRFDRWQAAQSYMRAHPDLSPMDAQIDFFDLERRRRGGIQAQMHGFRTVEEANRAMKAFERYGDSSYGTRGANARGLLRSYHGTASKPAEAPTAGPPPRAKENRPIMVDLHMDGKKMGRAIAMHQADDHLFPKKAGGMDTHGSWRPPGTPVTDAA